MYTIQSIAKKYGLRPKMLYRFCRQMGYLDQDNMPTKNSLDKKLCYAINGSYGYKPCFTDSGMREVIKSINENEIVMYYMDAGSNLSAASFERINNRMPLY